MPAELDADGTWHPTVPLEQGEVWIVEYGPRIGTAPPMVLQYDVMNRVLDSNDRTLELARIVAELVGQ